MPKNELGQLNMARLSAEQLELLQKAEDAINQNRKDPVFLMALCD